MVKDNTDLPPIPKAGTEGPEVCSIIRLYLAVLDDLSFEQIQAVSQHVEQCLDCAAEKDLLERVTKLAGRLPTSEPSLRVDHHIRAAIAAKGKNGQSLQRVMPGYRAPQKRNLWMLASLAAVLLFAAVFTTAYLSGLFLAQQTFTLPANLNWTGYVLYHTETKFDSTGDRYQIQTYRVLGTSHVHVETVMPGTFDVVLVGNEKEMLGMDMMHKVAQWGADAWDVDDSIFNLAQLRSDLLAKRAYYLDKDLFRGQEVYRIHSRNGLVLLLNMQYQPVNVLQGVTGPGTGEALYDICKMLSMSQVSEDMWDVAVPSGFQMGSLPPKP